MGPGTKFESKGRCRSVVSIQGKRTQREPLRNFTIKHKGRDITRHDIDNYLRKAKITEESLLTKVTIPAFVAKPENSSQRAVQLPGVEELLAGVQPRTQ